MERPLLLLIAPTESPGIDDPVFAQISELETRQVSSYNALQVTAERRAHGLGFLASYTYSHALDEGSGESAYRYESL